MAIRMKASILCQKGRERKGSLYYSHLESSSDLRLRDIAREVGKKISIPISLSSFHLLPGFSLAKRNRKSEGRSMVGRSGFQGQEPGREGARIDLEGQKK